MLGVLFYPEDGGSRILQNSGKNLQDYTALHSRKSMEMVIDG
jgi:hypothetical protein